MTGFHGKRSEFDHEYDNDAELLISELEFPPTDTQVSRLSWVPLHPLDFLDLISISLTAGTSNFFLIPELLSVNNNMKSAK